jgi:hypothetical protein
MQSCWQSLLQPFVLKVPNADAALPVYRVRVQFGCHVFSRALEASDPPDLHIQDGRALRCFCPVRHGLSRFLPGLVRHAADKSALISPLDNYCLLTNLRVWKVPMPYWVHVRFGSEADIRAAIELVRLVPEADVT